MRLAAMLLSAMMVALAAWGGACADVPRRVALVVTNGAYSHAGSLKNPVSDGSLVTGALKAAGFQIVAADPNLGIGPFRDALRRFHSNTAGAQVALVYYAGHGIEARGKNWLIPTDAILQQDSDLDYEAIDLDLVLSATEGADMRVVVLDACRNNPFGHAWRATRRAVGQGLAPIDVDDVLVIYSAAPGQTASDGRGANSPFAEALARRLPQAGLPIQLLGGMVRDDVLRATGQQQRPFISASITGTPFMLVPGATSPGPLTDAAVAVATATPPAAPDAKSVEMMFWQSASTGEDIGQLRAYLSRYPNGSFVELAKARIANLQRGPSSGGAESARNLSAPATDPRAMELAYWNSVSASNDPSQLSAYIDQYPTGQFVRLARAKIAALSRSSGASTAAGFQVNNGPPPAAPRGGGSAPAYAGAQQANAAAPAPAYSAPEGRFGASDDYVCNNGPPAEERTRKACKRLRGSPD
jgi:hypothetical protein